MKIVINTCCHGGFSLSEKAYAEYKKLGAEVPYYRGDVCRCDPVLVKIVEKLGEAANGRYAELKIVEIPDGVEYTIEEYDGKEWVAEVHRTWS